MTIREFQSQVAALHSGYTSCGVEARAHGNDIQDVLEYNVWIGKYKILVHGETPELAITAATKALEGYENPAPTIKVSPDMEIA